ncbi:COX15/CtaA family protein [Parvularcula dongshanensis]|uniref:Heme A synthase n=1 Tax=Parvularcula dongshanensis TaxID=1173995 RepID=A0A840I2R2_9PROT|nr:COX15/CtaA family protein [Parvularcula dongshanensis]MBB4658571.1 cytochrome c oxidase assembly protein subunit 15 [Parvularcula dongshanensis]
MSDAPRSVRLWLLLLAVLVAAMVIVGGATRLTDSGLSITEWDLVLGALPPMSHAHWEEAFALYRQIPEYHRVNAGMTLSEFQGIYWWEWSHRNLGRIIGLAVFAPLLWFSVRGTVRGRLRWQLWGLFALVCLQGAIGWYMVSSGLSERVDVSQYRLALHLSTALLLYALIVWQFLSLSGSRAVAAGSKLGGWAWGMLAAISLQIVLGAFVAGLRAGKTFNDWPLMGGKIVPEGYFGEPSRFADLFERVAAVQFNHRIGAYLVLAFAIAFAVKCYRAGRDTRRYGASLLGAVTFQAVIGIATVMAAVPLWLGLAHQAGALVVVTAAVWSVHALSGATRPARHPRSTAALSAVPQGR